MSEREVLKIAMRRDFLCFLAKAFETVSPGDVYQRNWHIEAIAHALDLVERGDDTRLVITQPPRSLKSICTSVAWVAWRLGHDPALRFICVSYSQELADKLSEQFRLIINSAWYRDLFPGLRVKQDTTREFTTTRGGGRLSTSTGGTLTGRGADVIIIDDPMKAADAMSETERLKTIEWFRTTLVTRLNDKEKGAIVLVMQRLHEEDLAGYVLETGGWDSLCLPAIAIEDDDIPIGDMAFHDRKAGDVLHPGRESREQLELMRKTLGSLAFSAQYQQRPTPVEGNLVKREWFRWYDKVPEGDGVRIVQSWDIAGTIGEGRDYSVCTTWVVKRKDYYLVDLWRGRIEIPTLRRKIVALQKEYNAPRVLIEGTGIGLGVYQDLVDEAANTMPRPIKVKPTADKLTRFEAQTTRIEAGQVHLPKDASWLPDFLHEVLAFPHGRHDDQVDSMSQFLADAQRDREEPVLAMGEGGKQENWAKIR